MQAAEGKGPKQVKSSALYPLGQFKTIYGNDGTPGTVNVASPPYTAVIGSTTASGTLWAGGIVGSVVPGLNLNVNGNGNTDVGVVCSPSPGTSLQDMETLYVDFFLTSTFSGSVTLSLQGSNDRFYNNTTYSSPAAWITILSGVTITGTLGSPQTFTLNNLATTAEIPKMCYRVVASGTGVGIIDWAIPGLFVDLYAMGVGANAGDANGSIGQKSIQGPRSLTISGGQVTSTVTGNPPYTAVKNIDDYIG